MTHVLTDDRRIAGTNTARRRPARPLITRLLAGVALVALSGCAALQDPYVSMGTDVPYRATHEEAVSFARKKEQELTDRRDQLERYEVSTGALALGSGIAGLAFAAFGAHTDAILGAGLVGGGAYGAGAYIPSQKRKSIYTKGAKAIECAIKATSIGLEDRGENRPGDGGYGVPKSLREDAQREGDGRSLDSYLAELNALTGGEGAAARKSETLMTQPSPLMKSAARSPGPLVRRAAVYDAQATLLDQSLVKARAAGRELAATVNALTVDRGNRLITATSDVLAAVSDQLDATRVDPDAALKAMRDGSLALVDQSKKANKKVQDAVASTEEAAVEANQALADAQIEGASPEGVADASGATEMKAELAAEIASTAAGLQKIVDDQAGCLRELTGEQDNGGSES